ncbi:MAG: AraC family transcriptional regulator [Oscillospiraceae bacterium]|jgi:AraC-like DNA-binding protein|nr:AraC family transcriptional regulator [Oscillospiraceae bacterium]
MPTAPYANPIPDLDYFSYRNADASWSIEPTRIGFFDISYVVEGEAEYVLDERTLTVRKGDLLYVPPQTLRQGRLTGAQHYEVYALNFRLRNLSGEAITSLPFETVTPIGIHPELISLYKALSTAWLLQDKGYELMTRAYVELILSKLLDLAVYKNPVSVADRRVRQVVEYITEHYSQSLALQEIARQVQLSPSYLSSLFHRSMGMTLNRYINQIRVNHAESLLMNNMANVTEAAERCGFCDVYYFSRVFTEIKGYNPRDTIGKRW